LKWNKWACALVIGCSSFAYGESTSINAPVVPEADQSSSSTTFIDAVKQKQFEEDSRINDLQIRADAGSLSRYSLKFIVGYAGPSLTDLSQPNIPNPSGATSDTRSYVSGYLGAKYRITSNDGIYVSAGLRGYIKAQTGDNQDLTDPSISYDHTYLFSPTVQARTQVGISMVTNSFYRNMGETNGAQIAQYTKWRINNSRWIVGGEVEAWAFSFNRGYDTKDKYITDYYFNGIPSLEYQLTDNLNLSSSAAKKIAHYRRTDAPSTFDAETNLWSARLGVGWAVQHDIYLNPYIGFYPEAMTWTNASIGFNGVISVF
jgi:hypothetical protein